MKNGTKAQTLLNHKEQIMIGKVIICTDITLMINVWYFYLTVNTKLFLINLNELFLDIPPPQINFKLLKKKSYS